MTTPPSESPPAEPPVSAAQDRQRASGSGLVASRPAAPPAAAPTGQAAAQAAPAKAAADAAAAAAALGVPAAAAAETAQPAAPGGLARGQVAGRTTAQLAVGAVALPAAAGSTAVLGERIGVGQGQGLAPGQDVGVSRGQAPGLAQGQAQTLGQAQGRGQAQVLGRGVGQATATGVAVAAPPRGIGSSERELPDESEVDPGPDVVVTSKPTSTRTPVSLFGVRAGQVVAWELAVLAVALIYREPLPVLIPVCVAAFLVLVLSMVRRRGRWLYQWLALWLRFRARRRRYRMADIDQRGDIAVREEASATLLAALARGAEIRAVEIDEIEVAFFSHAGGLTAVLEVAPLDSGHFVEPSQLLPPLTAFLPTADIGEPVVSAQVVIQSIPAPNFLGLEDSAAISYRELAGGVVPATRSCWLALQAQRVAEDYTEARLQETVMHAVRRLQRRLRKAGLRARMLNPDEIATELLDLARVQAPDAAPSGTAPQNPVVIEGWRTWSAGPQVHTAFRLLDWPDLADADGRELLDRLVHPPTLATTVSVAARRRLATDDIELEAAIRVTLPAATDVRTATEEIRTTVEKLGGRVQRLDGEQVFGVAASLPLGGFLA